MDVPQPKRSPRNNCKDSSLFDIGRNMSDLTGDEKVFYDDQCGSRNHLLSQETDWAHEEEQQAVLQEQIRGAQQLQEELKFVNEDMEVIPATSSRRMSLVDAPATVDKETQVNILEPPPICKCRNATYEIKDTIATGSCKAAITVEKARIATKVVCEKFYGHQYYLEPPHDLSSDGARSKKPRSSDDYQIYEKVRPSSNSINNFKQKKSAHSRNRSCKCSYQ